MSNLKHFPRMNMTLEEKLAHIFNNAIKLDNGCWLDGIRLTAKNSDKEYPYFTHYHRSGHVSHWICCYRLGVKRLPKGMEALHECMNGSCINPDHVYPASHAENMRFPDHAKLTEQQVQQILQSRKNRSHTLRELASRFGVSNPLISKIEHQTRWKGLHNA